MSESIVSTRNVERMWGALEELAQRLQDPERLGIGLCFGDPGRGKTCTAEYYHGVKSGEGSVQTYWVRSSPLWTPPTMLRALLSAAGIEGSRRGADDLLRELQEALLKRPGLFIIDEVDTWIVHERMAAIIKHIHDTTSCAFMLIGEPKCRAIIRRYVSFESRLNDRAIVEVDGHTPNDVATVVANRCCGLDVAPAVIRDIHREFSTSMRHVVRQCHRMKAFARTNNLKAIGPAEYRAIRTKRSNGAPAPIELSERLPAVGGNHG